MLDLITTLFDEFSNLLIVGVGIVGNKKVALHNKKHFVMTFTRMLWN